MTAATATALLAAAVAVLMALNTKRGTCLRRGHDLSYPWTENGRRIERCERCGIVRDHVYVIPTAPVLSQEQINGSVPMTYEAVGRSLDEVEIATQKSEAKKAEHARIAAKVRAQWSDVTDSRRVN